MLYERSCSTKGATRQLLVISCDLIIKTRADCKWVSWSNFLQVALCSHFVFIWVFFHKHSRFTGWQGEREAISLTHLYHFHPLHRHLDINRTITIESSPLTIPRSWTGTGNLWILSVGRYSVSCAPRVARWNFNEFCDELGSQNYELSYHFVELFEHTSCL